MRKLVWFAVLFFSIAVKGQLTPDKLYGDLFHEVQMQRVFADGKTFVDCIPKKDPAAIMKAYRLQKTLKTFNLKSFVEANFTQPREPALNYITKEKDVFMHINNLWAVLKRDADKAVKGSSLLPLPYPYIVPGGRFREIYYWDSYFTMLGLEQSGEIEMIASMIRNFDFLIKKYGHIPNGNRTYYLSRSQPPFFSLMVQLLAQHKGDSVYRKYLPALEKEYNYWMQGAANLKRGAASKYVVRLPDGTILNRYWDNSDAPRQESYREDIEVANEAVRNFIMVAIFKDAAHQKKASEQVRKIVYRHLRAGATSGIDFSSRWFADGKNLATIHTTDFIPVDLNSLLYNLESVLALAHRVNGNQKASAAYDAKAKNRMAAVVKYCWNATSNFYTDYDFVNTVQSSAITPAGLYPFCMFPLSDSLHRQAIAAGEVVRQKLLKPGGIVTSTENTGQQWDAPNGWAPLQWMSIWGLDRAGQSALAREIAARWVKLNKDVFDRTGRLMEKYNVEQTELEAGGGEYPSQDGFGWTNGVLLRLSQMLQTNTGKINFPHSFIGSWKGKLNWHPMGKPMQQIPMQLNIQQAAGGMYTWTMIYGDSMRDNREYLLKAVDSATGHWVIDERNGILLDQYWIAGKLSSAFSVGNTKILNTYTLNDNHHR